MAFGLADRVVPAQEFLVAAVSARGARRTARAPHWLRRRRRSGRGDDPGRRRASRGSDALFLELFGTPDQREGMRAFLEKREPRFGA